MNLADWRLELSDLLSSYFGDQSIERGIEEMALVSEDDPACHERWMATLEEAIRAARSGDGHVCEIIRESFAAHVETPDEAAAFLANLRASYLRRRGNSTRPAHD